MQILFFAALREQLGCAQIALELPSDVATIGQLRTHLCQRGHDWQNALAPTRAVRAACNQTMAQHDTPVRDGDEVAFFPPVTGG